MRQCTKCKEVKGEDGFYHSQSDSICKECRKKYRREHYKSVRSTPVLTEEEKKERYNAYHRRYREDNRQNISERRRSNYSNRTDKQKELKRQRSTRRNAFLYTEGYSNVVKLREYVKACGVMICSMCNIEYDSKHMHVDHIIPLSKGGTNNNDNLQILCGTCNRKKHNS